MKQINYYLCFVGFFSLVACSSGRDESNTTNIQDSTLEEAAKQEQTPSLKIEEAFNSKATMEELFKQDIAEGYTFRYKQIGEQYALGGYTHQDTTNFGAKLFVNINLHSCQKTPCHSVDEEGRNKQLELDTYYFKDEQKKSEHFEYTAEEMLIGGKKLNLYYRYRWFPPKEPKDTINNKKLELVLCYNNGTNGIKVTAFPNLKRNLSAEQWKTVINKEGLKSHAKAVIAPYLPYY